jgi:hypothetical protein
MSTQQYDDNYWDEDEDVDSGQDSRQFKELRKADRSKAARIKELEEALTSMSKQVRDRSVKDVLQSRGLNPKIASFIPESVENSEEAIAKWVDEYGDVFGAPPVAQETAQAETGDIPGVTTPAMLDPNIATMQANAQVASAGNPYAGDPGQLQSLIASASTAEELNTLLFGNPHGPSAF